MTTPKRNARANVKYEPNDSPFGDAFNAWREGTSDGNVVVNGIVSLDADPNTLQELASCAHSLLGTPIYENDQDLKDFASDLESTPAPKPTGEEAARALYRTDWDLDGTDSIHLPRGIAIKLLLDKGWAYSLRTGWNSPDGNQYWERDEALRIALTAEALS